MLIDPIYEKFTKSVIRAIGSTEFYEFFMDALSKAENEFQFSNRKMEKYIDNRWIDAIEESLEGFQNIIDNPRNVIKEEELIVNVAHAKKGGSDVVRHLAQHGALVESFNEDSGEVRPARLMQKYREDSTELYENRLAFTVLEEAYHFVRLRHEALLGAMGDEFGARLKVKTNMESARELVHVDMFLHIKEKDSLLETDAKNRETYERISRLYRLLGSFMSSQFAEQFSRLNRVKGNIMRTNVLKKNPDYKKIVKLWEFLREYDDAGYVINILEQNPRIDERFQRDIFHNILFQYIILKGYLEDEKDREVPTPLKKRKRKLKPKVVRQIIEELSEDYDLRDVEIRKVIVEELERKGTEAEAAELPEEEEKPAEPALDPAEEEAKKQARIEQIKQDMEDRRRGLIFRKELDWFREHKQERLELRTSEQKLRQSREKERMAAEMAVLRRYQKELDYFKLTLPVNLEARKAAQEAEREEQERLLEARALRQEQKKPHSWMDRWKKGHT